MKTKLILVATLALNVVLAVMLLVPRGDASAPVPRAPAIARLPARSTDVTPATTNITTQVIPFHWRQVESEDYRRYIANLRAIGCPERLIHDIILADINELYDRRERDMETVAFEPWFGADRQEAERRNQNARERSLQDERSALVRELLGTEWSENGDKGWVEEEIVALLLGYLPDGVPLQLMALVEKYGSLGSRVRAEAHGILLDEDFAKLEALHAGLLNGMAALLSPADMEELRLRAQLFTMFDGVKEALEGVEVSGAELREIMRASLVMGDIFREILDHRSEGLPEGEKERREAGFEQRVAQILGPERYGDYQLAKDSDYRDAFNFAHEKKLSKPVARTVGRAMAGAREQLAEIQKDKSLTPDERKAALAVLAAVTRNSVSAALGPAAAEYLKENGGFLPELDGTSKKSGGKR